MWVLVRGRFEHFPLKRRLCHTDFIKAVSHGGRTSEKDSVAFRLMFCAANKALLVSEPVIDQEPFVPGCHFVTSPVEKMAETIEFYLSHEDQRRQIAEQAHHLVCGEYSMQSMVGRILDDARALHSD